MEGEFTKKQREAIEAAEKMVNRNGVIGRRIIQTLEAGFRKANAKSTASVAPKSEVPLSPSQVRESLKKSGAPAKISARIVNST